MDKELIAISPADAKKLMQGSQLAEFYAGWNAAIHAVEAVAKAQGWWFPESVRQLLVDEQIDLNCH